MSATLNSPLRAVVDTNVFVSAFLHPNRSLYLIVDQAALGQYCLLLSPALVSELGKVMTRELGYTEQEKLERLKPLVKSAEIVLPRFTLSVIQEDPADNRVLECAVAGKADVIVSGDQHLRDLKSYQSIPIVRPVDFLRTLGVV